MSRIWGRGPSEFDVESEREALRRQRLAAAAELETLKAALADRVAHVQERERELERALAQVEKREQALDAAAGKGARLKAVGAWVEAQAARAARSDEKTRVDLDELRAELAQVRATLETRERELAASAEQLAAVRAAPREENGQAPALEPPPSTPATTANEDERALDARAAELDAREARLAAAEAELFGREGAPVAAPVDEKRDQELASREAEQERRPEELTALERALADREAALDTQARGELELAEAKLQEVRVAEQAFVRTRAELAARSDALAEREAELKARERALAEQEAPPTPDLDALEARIRRLEGSRNREASTQTFSAGLRALQDRRLRGPADERKEPLH